MYFCEGLKNATTDDDKFALTTQIINVAMEVKGNPCFSLRILPFFSSFVAPHFGEASFWGSLLISYWG